MNIERSEHGWPTHFICANKCLYRRHTRLVNEEGTLGVIISTIGAMRVDGKLEPIGFGRAYETFIFPAKKEGSYIEADTSVSEVTPPNYAIPFPIPEEIIDCVDNTADLMHEEGVEWAKEHFEELAGRLI